ncbi:bacillithiol system redox-active protein YtxJ [Psychroflexus lacisalsi]|jgi:bacillithiol system protein YtxJ|uniref:Bacillithiol system redox-active protein YtxJ n=1 Tax=Psychroflexus lacisalsi TaxID=503928 RepID=A0ABN1K8B1_9FLAO|nr:bacillithiol system redox-active protein YtxJ [Psychroflexus lacisalsi]MBZ9619620.1 bacillithiol system redox-active protein YtxJ [Psychroflexus lacisalsi]
MGFFDQLFNTKPTQSENTTKASNFTWRTLEDITQLNALEKLSEEKLVVIFKHSVTCGISNMVWHQFQNEIDFNNDYIEMLYLDLLAHRDISNEITRRFQVLHQSPQILVIKNAEVLHHASHSAIHISDIKRFLPE